MWGHIITYPHVWKSDGLCWGLGPHHHLPHTTSVSHELPLRHSPWRPEMNLKNTLWKIFSCLSHFTRTPANSLGYLYCFGIQQHYLGTCRTPSLKLGRDWFLFEGIPTKKPWSIMLWWTKGYITWIPAYPSITTSLKNTVAPNKDTTLILTSIRGTHSFLNRIHAHNNVNIRI